MLEGALRQRASRKRESINIVHKIDKDCAMTTNWGTLARGQLNGESLVRQRSFGLLPATRYYNEQAAPGIGSLWFVRKLYPSILALYIADQDASGLRIASKLRLANAIEAYSCYLTLDKNREARFTQGRRKFRLPLDEPEHYPNYFSFENLQKPSAYVSAPFRQSCTTTLHALGLVSGDSQRFNRFSLSDNGLLLAKAMFQAAPKGAKKKLKDWIQGEVNPKLSNIHLYQMDLAPDNEVCNSLERVVFNESTPDGRLRRSLRNWFDEIMDVYDYQFMWSQLPDALAQYPDYWKRLHEAANYMAFLNSLRDVLTGLELVMDAGQWMQPEDVKPSLADGIHDVGSLVARAKRCALRYLELLKDNSPDISCAKDLAGTMNKMDYADTLLFLCGQDSSTLDTDGRRVFLKTKRPARLSIPDEDPLTNGWGLFSALPASLPNLYWLAKDLSGRHEELIPRASRIEEDNEEEVSDER